MELGHGTSGQKNSTAKTANNKSATSSSDSGNEPLRRVKSTSNYTDPLGTVKFWRIAFKVTDLSFDFRRYDLLDTSATGIQLFTDPESLGNTYYDLCRQNKRYQPFHPDFVQTYFLSLFGQTSFPCNIFVFIEELKMNKGVFVEEPHDLTMSAADLSPNEKKAQLAALAAREERANAGRPQEQPSFLRRLLGTKSNIHRVQFGKNDSCTVAPDFELFYLESPKLNTDAGSVNDLFLSLTSRYLRGSPAQRGVGMLRHHSFVCFTDSCGMEFMRYIGFRGLVPTMRGANTLIPLILLIGEALGYKHSLSRVNELLAKTMKQKLSLGPRRLNARPKYHLRALTAMYQQAELFLTQTYLRSHLDYRNRLANDLANELSTRLSIKEDYERIKEQLKPLQQLQAQLSTQEIIKAQGSLRFAIIALGFTMVLAVVAVCVILGVEPMMRLLNQLGIQTPSWLNLQ